MSAAVEIEVDELLLEHGEYTPLELLLRSGRLMYADYEAWRDGELRFLDQTLFGDPAQVLQTLVEAEHYLERRGWRAELLEYRPWSRQAGVGAPPLRFSAAADLDACFHRRYRRPADQPQLDLFTDAPGTALGNGIVRALEDRDPLESRRLLERLYDVAPDHPRLGALERLTEALEDPNGPVQDVGGELARLEETLTPLAEEVLGTASRHVLIPLWRRLTEALDHCDYDPAHPRLHASYTARMALDWRLVRETVEREAGWERESLLLERYAVACERQHELTQALPTWFTLCWHFPEQAELVESSANHVLVEEWEAFQDHEPALPVSAFPAWLLVQRPALTGVLPEPGADCPESYATVYQLQRRRPTNGPDEGVLELRARLKQQDALLFTAYMETLSHPVG